ncbi:MAG TPA: thioredoxin, partial [Planctomycetaceae bacterium]|nr:thioredoxin [Planctomycetaceae bacterium]
TICQTKITNINRYHGPANVEIGGAPAVGRSGGGLFDMGGRLIGVCNAADDIDDEGIYAGVEVVFAQLERLHLDAMVAAVGGSQNSTVVPASHVTAADNPMHSSRTDFADARNTGIELEPPIPTASRPAPTNMPSPVQQIVCIITATDGSQRQVTINRPDAALVGAINGAQN